MKDAKKNLTPTKTSTFFYREAETVDPHSGPHVSQGIAQGALPASDSVDENKGEK